jgi:phosphoribosylglycinamide formyltransferase 1
MKQIIIFASGAGSNAREVLKRLHAGNQARVALIVTNNPRAGVLRIADEYGVPTLTIEKERFFQGDAYLPELEKYQPDLLVLAGFLWKVPDQLISAFPDTIINIHPALLPKYGGKGMYGHHVHQAVLQAGEKESGITIHKVDGHYDNGDIIFQAKCPVLKDDTPESLAKRIHQLEHEHYPRIIEQILSSQIEPQRQ